MPESDSPPAGIGHLLVPDDLIPNRALTDVDEDSFNHEAIAGTIAELVATAPTPVNIALFGSWGSGKSSMCQLLKRKLARSGDIAVVRYDAWKFGATSLQKNFISHAATALGLKEGKKKNRPFHRGLYQSTRTLDLEFGQFLSGGAGQLLTWTGAALAAVLVFVLLVAGGVAHLLDVSVLETVLRALLGTASTVAVWIVAAAVALRLFDIARVDIEETAPSTDEQFSRTFEKLIRQAKKRGSHRGFKRVLFFVDELDRCSEETVVETLTAIQTFLDIESCVFVVVADRDAIDEALASLPQSTPPHTEDPYYSSAGAFLDKIFEYQFELPPLRSSRLTQYALELVLSREGVWGELRAESTSLLRDVVYVLVPTHVRSPRRVKTLLNRFATNARMNGARGIDWKNRAEELAKFTVLQIEFPVVAAALVREPRLPTLMLQGAGIPTAALDSTEAIRAAIAEGDTPSDERGSDGPLAKMLTATPAVHAQHRRQLMRYLQRTAHVPDPGRDLLYIEPAGTATGLNPEVGQALENLAVDSPSEASSMIGSLMPDAASRALQFLAEMSEREQGRERSNIIGVLSEAAPVISRADTASRLAILKAIHSFARAQPFATDHLPGLFSVALDSGDERLIQLLLDDSRFVDDGLVVSKAACHLDRLEDGRREKLEEALGHHAETNLEVLVEPLQALSEETSSRLLGQAIDRYLATTKEGEEGRAAVHAGLEEFLESPITEHFKAQTIKVIQAFDESLAYKLLPDHVDLEAVRDPLRTTVALVALLEAPSSEWERWLRFINAPSGFAGGSDRAEKIVAKIFEQPEEWAPEAETQALKVIQALRPSLPVEALTAITNAMEEALLKTNWWTSAELTTRQEAIHSVGAALVEDHGGADIVGKVSKARTKDLARSIPHVSSRAATAAAIKGMSRGLIAEDLVSLAGRLADARSGAPGAAHKQIDSAVLGLAEALPPTLRREIALPSTSSVMAAAVGGSSVEWAVIKSWLNCEPSLDDVSDALVGETKLASKKGAPEAFRAWLGKCTEQNRTNLVLSAWSDTYWPIPWIRMLQSQGLDEATLARHINDQVGRAAHSTARRRLVTNLVRLQPSQKPALDETVSVIVKLLQSKYKVDYRLGLKALTALGSGYRGKKKIRQALREGFEKHGELLTEDEARLVEEKGLKVLKRMVSDSTWKTIKANRR